jgi:hypothetical protein
MVLLRKNVHGDPAKTGIAPGQGLTNDLDWKVPSIPTGFDLGNFAVNEGFDFAP